MTEININPIEQIIWDIKENRIGVTQGQYLIRQLVTESFYKIIDSVEKTCEFTDDEDYVNWGHVKQKIEEIVKAIAV